MSISRTLRRANIALVALVATACVYYFISRQVFFSKATTAFPDLPIDSSCYHLPWPFGPSVIRRLEPDHPAWIVRDSIEPHSEGLRVKFIEARGSFVIEPE